MSIFPFVVVEWSPIANANKCKRCKSRPRHRAYPLSRFA